MDFDEFPEEFKERIYEWLADENLESYKAVMIQILELLSNKESTSEDLFEAITKENTIEKSLVIYIINLLIDSKCITADKHENNGEVSFLNIKLEEKGFKVVQNEKMKLLKEAAKEISKKFIF
ncbi:hypothetical protein [Lysinibacillus fusiformis]|uniref:hypothetical protein n=1 Tax=Lysinibacillus fusiformis TaxID=28031 RepID=UPI0020BF47A8|nr:hypothetical protein [Lysinibacillus fusiformis]